MPPEHRVNRPTKSAPSEFPRLIVALIRRTGAHVSSSGPRDPKKPFGLHSYAVTCSARRFRSGASAVPMENWVFQVAPRSSPRLLCNAAEYVFPDPIPEFADAETSKFKAHLLEKLSKKDIFGDSLEEVVRVCTEQILSNFLHSEYGGPGTLMVVPFIDMADTINERGLPGGPQAARAAVVWAQNHIDKDWKDWTGDPNL
ncbi:hypothetical protein AXF42_Ash002843 [Apostasia shenzhenica]|uniref:Protein plastid redox insensitive 2, chloroplastic n=1 Tax=Apostasia shenzhenica TaxID=1088818 RepID=A0A2I0A7G2_9ASPA|nr:hypothetical protein AXF42_Ash002843 [Apostasia shenzhenica]